MRSAVRIALPFLALSLAAGLAQALDFKSVGPGPAVLYDAPSEKGRKVFVAPRGMPVEVILSYGEWTKVRDATGDLSWIRSQALVSQRAVVTSVTAAKVRAAASDSSAVVFTADRGVLLALTEPAGAGWIKVRHRDGLVGFVRASEVWGE